ncbi:MAG: hypothetical protein Q4E17_01380, partial [Synergistes sp.]|nr:hypothetical protein [Synergistes sp.]
EDAEKDHAHKSRYEIEIMGIMRKKLPELTDEFVTGLMHTGKKTVEDFRVLVKKQLENDAARRSKEAFESLAIENITDKSEVDVPELLINRETEALKKDEEERFKREGIFKDMDDFFEKSGTTKEAYEADLKKTAERIVKRSLVIEAIAEANDINAKPDEIVLEIKKAALMSGVEPKKLIQYVKGDKERFLSFMERVRRNKTIAFIAENVKTKEPKAKPEAEA